LQRERRLSRIPPALPLHFRGLKRRFGASIKYEDMTRERLIIAIDGPSAAGKTSAARTLAKRLGYIYLDSGALYRAIAWKVSQSGIEPKEHPQLADLLSKTEIRVKALGDDFRVWVG